MPGSDSGGSSGGSGSDGLDAETAQLMKAAPLHARIAEALDKFIQGLPDEIIAVLNSLGASVTSSRHLKTSFHKTFLVELDPPLVHEQQSHAKVIVQILGVEMGDKHVFGDVLQAATLKRAHELAALAGVRVPAVFATGRCESGIGSLEFIVEEFVLTQTVEDKVRAPRKEWARIHQEVVAKLKGFSLAGMETSPLPRYDTCQSYIEWLSQKVPASDEALAGALARVREMAMEAGDAAPVLLHQDINDGNLLCSKCSDGDGWKLDALIDWESAAVVDARCYDALYARKNELWATVQMFATVVKCSHLAERFAQEKLPRCELAELLEGYEEAARRLEKQGLLPFETWAARVARCQAASGATGPSGYAADVTTPTAPAA